VRRRLITFLAALVVAAFLIVGGYHLGQRQPYCPTEDSCRIDYRHGRWFIEPTVP